MRSDRKSSEYKGLGTPKPGKERNIGIEVRAAADPAPLAQENVCAPLRSIPDDSDKASAFRKLLEQAFGCRFHGAVDEDNVIRRISCITAHETSLHHPSRDTKRPKGVARNPYELGVFFES